MKVVTFDEMGIDMSSHVDHIVESQHPVSFHHAVDAIGHPVRQPRHIHGVGSSQGTAAIWLASLVRCIGHQHKAELFDGLHKRGDNILRTAC